MECFAKGPVLFFWGHREVLGAWGVESEEVGFHKRWNPILFIGSAAKVSKGRPQSPLVASAEAKPLAGWHPKRKIATIPGRDRMIPTNSSMRRACCAPLRPSWIPTEGKSRGVEDPFGRSPEGSALWSPKAKRGKSRGGHSPPLVGCRGKAPATPAGQFFRCQWRLRWRGGRI